MTSVSLRNQVVSPKSVRLPPEVVSKAFGLGLKHPPPLEVVLSNDNTLLITVDDVLETTTYRLFTGGWDCVGREVLAHQTGIDGDVLDGLLEEVRASNAAWWVDSASTDMGAGVES